MLQVFESFLSIFRFFQVKWPSSGRVLPSKTRLLSVEPRMPLIPPVKSIVWISLIVIAPTVGTQFSVLRALQSRRIRLAVLNGIFFFEVWREVVLLLDPVCLPSACRMLKDTPVAFAGLTWSFLMNWKTVCGFFCQGRWRTEQLLLPFFGCEASLFTKSKQLEVSHKIWQLITRLKLRRKLFLRVHWTYTNNLSPCTNNLLPCTNWHVDVFDICQDQIHKVFFFHLMNWEMPYRGIRSSDIWHCVPQ